jgi:hypothetical protein
VVREKEREVAGKREEMEEMREQLEQFERLRIKEIRHRKEML